MIKINRTLWEKHFAPQTVMNSLPSELLTIIAQGFERKSGCAFLASLAKRQMNSNANDFPDKTGYECFVNSIHIDDYMDDNYFRSAVTFANKVKEAWLASASPEILRFLIMSNDLGAIVKFHVVRAGECWLDENIDEYGDGILVLE